MIGTPGSCPQDTRLECREIDHELRLLHYRAPAETCNSCSIKAHRTGSDRARTISVSLDPWVRSAAGRFQRGITLVLLVLAAVIVCIELLRHAHGVEGWALGSLLAFISLSVLSLINAAERL